MNNADLFNAAHSLTKATIQSNDSYAVTFAAALRTIRQEAKTHAAMKAAGRFSAVFVKRTTGNERRMLATLSIPRDRVKGGMKAYDAAMKGLAVVWDVEAEGIRSIPLNAVTSLVAA